MIIPEHPGASSLQDPPTYKILRYEKVYTYRRDAGATGFIDRIKYIPSTNGGEVYLSIGGEIRQRYEYTANPEWGQTPQDKNGAFLHRYVLHGDWHVYDQLRFLGQLYSALVESQRYIGRVADNGHKFLLAIAGRRWRLPSQRAAASGEQRQR